MKKVLAIMTIVVAMSSIAMAQTSPSTAPTTKPAMKPTMQTETEQFRASDILGAKVKNAAGDTVADVKDLVILRDEKVLQAVLSVGGFLGIGDKFVAVPYDKLQVRRADDKINVMYNATKADLEGMPKFPYTESDVGGMTLRARDLIGASVENANDETVGEVDDLLITSADYVPQVILSVGGFLGAGEKLVAVPYDTLNITHADNQQQVRFDTTKEKLKALPSYTHKTYN